MAFSKNRIGRQDQLSSFKSAKNYRDLNWAVTKSLDSPSWGNNLARCIKFGNLNYFTSGKVDTDTYKAFEGEAKLLIAMLRTIQSAEKDSAPQDANEETIEPLILTRLGVDLPVPRLPAGGSASSLAKWLSNVGVKKGDEKKDPRTDPLTRIVTTVNNNIKRYLESYAKNWPDEWDSIAGPYKTDAQLKAIHRAIQKMSDEVKEFMNSVGKSFERLDTDLNKHRDTLEETSKNHLARIDLLQKKTDTIEANVAGIENRIGKMKDEIDENFRNEISRINGDYQQLKGGQEVLRQVTINQQISQQKTDEMHDQFQRDVTTLYAKVYALSITQRLHLDLTEMLYTANNICCALALAVGAGFDQYQTYAKNDNDHGAAHTMLLKGIGYVCKKIPVLGAAYEVFDDAAGGISKIWGEGNAALESNYDSLSAGQENKIPASVKKTAIQRLKSWVIGCKQNKELQGHYFLTGLRAIPDCSRTSLSNHMRDEVTRRSEAFLKDYKMRISVLLDNDFVMDEIKKMGMTKITPGDAHTTGVKLINNVLADLSPLEYTDGGVHAKLVDSSKLFSPSFISCMTELYLYGKVRSTSKVDPSKFWENNSILKRLGSDYDNTSYELFQKRSDRGLNDGDTETLLNCSTKIPLPQGKLDNWDNRKSIAHAVLVGLYHQIDDKTWGEVFKHEPQTVEEIKRLLGMRVDAAMRYWFVNNFQNRLNSKDPSKKEVNDEYIRLVRNRPF